MSEKKQSAFGELRWQKVVTVDAREEADEVVEFLSNLGMPPMVELRWTTPQPDYDSTDEALGYAGAEEEDLDTAPLPNGRYQLVRLTKHKVIRHAKTVAVTEPWE